MASKPIRQVGRKFTQTVAAQYSDPAGDDCFVPGWDAKAAGEQGMQHVKPRQRMGIKKTPIGAGTLRPSR